MANIIEVKVPNIGDFEEVEIIEVTVEPNQSIEAEQSLITLETDKAAMEVPSPHAGKVKQLRVKRGDKVKEGDVILELEIEGAVAATANPESQPSEPPPKPQASEQPSPSSHVQEAMTATLEKLSLPDLGTQEQVLVIEWTVMPGDKIAKDQSVMTLESDKASMDVPSPFEGILKEQLVKVGDKVNSGTPVAVIEVLGTSQTAAPKPETKVAVEQPLTAPPAKTPTDSASVIAAKPATTGLVHAGPGVRRLAHQLGVDLTQVKGSGHKGRIDYADVHQFVKQSLQEKGQASAVEPMPAIDFSQWGQIEVKPLNRIKKLTAKNLHRNWVNIPHVTQFDEADISELERFRNDNKASAKAMGFGLTPLSFIIKAVVSSLQAYPQFNSSLDANGSDLVYKKYFHIGVAVDTPNGLVVPVVRDVDKKGLFAIAKELNELGQKARDGKLKREEMQGSCFSISSLGSIGGTAFTPIINAPDVAILGVSQAQIKPVYDGASFVPKLMLPLSLSYDHRVIDGAEAARFCRHLCAQLEDIRKLLL